MLRLLTILALAIGLAGCGFHLRNALKLPADVPAFAMAPITYGKSEEHLHFPGTVTLSGETLLATMNDGDSKGETCYTKNFIAEKGTVRLLNKTAMH